MQQLLIKFSQETAEADVAQALAREAGAGLRLYRAVDGGECYALSSGIVGQDVQAALREKHPAARIVALTLTTDLVGEAAGRPAPWFYVVETDIEPDAEADFNRWYETEHLPGLAAVPGTVRARRYTAHGDTPRYYACYDLATRETFGSPAWLAVRATGWSSRVRPSFINTKRTLFRLAPLSQET